MNVTAVIYRHANSLLALAGLSLPLYAAIIPNPIWFGDPNTTYQSYTFSTSSTTPLPESLANPYGDPEMLITVVPYIGVGEGYQDPAIPWSINRVDGAWDLGPDGSIQVDVPVAAPVNGGPGYVVDYFISVIYEPTAGFYSLPDVFLDPVSIASTNANPTFELEDNNFFYWGLLSAEGTISEVSANRVRILVDATEPNGSLIDTVEIHTRYTLIPETSVYSFVLGLGSLGLILLRRHRLTAARRRADISLFGSSEIQ